MDDWDDYRFFLATAENGSFSAAARVLQVSQPTVSRRIGQLEARLGTRLFDHRSDGIALTDAGQDVVELARAMEETTHRLTRRVQGFDSVPCGKVALTTTEGLASHWLAPKLTVFRELYPDIEVSLLIGNSDFDLLRGEADVALRFGAPRSLDLVGREVGKAHCGIYASEVYLDAHGAPESLADLAGHHLIEAVGQLGQFRQCRELNEIMRGSPRAVCADNIYAQMALAQAGLGLFAVTCYMAEAAPGLKRLLVSEFDMPIDLWLLVHPDMKGAARVRAVMDFVAAEVSKDAPLFTGRTRLDGSAENSPG